MNGGQTFVVVLLCFLFGFLCGALILIKLEDNKEQMIRRLREELRK